MSSTEYGYIPHEGQGTFKCDRCGCDRFYSYPQGIDMSAPEWTYEYRCVKCDHIMGLTLVKKKD